MLMIHDLRSVGSTEAFRDTKYETSMHCNLENMLNLEKWLRIHTSMLQTVTVWTLKSLMLGESTTELQYCKESHGVEIQRVQTG